MIVYCNCGFPLDLWNKVVYVNRFLSGMIYHFQNLSFGDDVKEISYYIVSGDSVFLLSFGTGISYRRRGKNIGSIFVMDFEEIQTLEGAPLLSFVSKELIKETKKFAEKKIKNFNLEAYIKSLEEYFAEAKELIERGKDPAESKVLNEDIQIAMAKKFSNL